jgi:hypothetical protein
MGPVTQVTEEWARVPVAAVGSAPNCVQAGTGILCAVKALGQFVRVRRANSSAELASDAFWIGAFHNSATHTQALTSPPAIVAHPSGRATIAIRDADGSLLRTVFNPVGNTFTAWTDMGGYLRSGTQPSCVADGEVAVCAIQGPDGAGYVKRFPAAAGL